jgi:transposase
MDRLDEKQLRAIEAELAKRLVAHWGLDLRCLLFDATNFFSFVDSFNARPKLLQRGKSKEGRSSLRLLSLALLVSADHHVPLFHHTYAGNQPDSVTFGQVSAQLAQRCRQLAEGACDITLVFDKGNNSAANLRALEGGPFHFVGSLVPTQHPDLLALQRAQMRRLVHPALPEVWACRTRKVVFGVERTVLVTYNRKLYDAQCQTLQREIAKRQRALQELQTALQRAPAHAGAKAPSVASTAKKVEALLQAQHMRELFPATISSDSAGRPQLSFHFAALAWENLCRTLLGKTILFTDREDWTDEQIVLAYRSQWHVEAAFRQMKDPHFLAFRPAFHWTDQKLRVHAFYCVVALMLLSLLQRTLEKAGIVMSIPKTIERLSAIQEVDVIYPSPQEAPPRVCTVLSATDEQQRELIRVLNLERYRKS